MLVKKEKYGINVTCYYEECAHPHFIPPPLLLLGFESANPLIYSYPLLFDTQEQITIDSDHRDVRIQI